MPEPITVRVRDCACPGTPHADTGDVVLLRPTLSLAGGLRAQQDILASQTPDGGVDAPSLTIRWMETFVRYGAYDWNLPEPFGIEALLADFSIAAPVAEAAEERYSEAVLRPLGITRPPTLPDGPTVSSTPRTPRSRRSPA